MAIRTKVAVMAVSTVAVAMACMLAPAVRAQDGLVQGGGGGIGYVSGGIGIEERAAMAARRAQFNLYLTFRRRGSGELLAGVSLRVLDDKQDIVLVAEGVGPQVHVQLPPGTYRVHVTGDAGEQVRSVKIGQHGTHAVVFRFDPAGLAAAR